MPILFVSSRNQHASARRFLRLDVEYIPLSCCDAEWPNTSQSTVENRNPGRYQKGTSIALSRCRASHSHGIRCLYLQNRGRAKEMCVRKFSVAGVITLLLSAAAFSQTIEVRRIQTAEPVLIAKRHTLAIRYKDNDETSVNIVGTPLDPRAIGKAEIKRKDGRTRVKLKMESLGHPQALGAYYTTYILWAIAPEGQADNLAELPIKNDFEVEVTTAFQTFGLIVTAEPHSAVKLPSPVIVAENTLRRGTEGGIQTSRIEYTGDPGTFYATSTQNEPAFSADYNTPLMILGARRAVEIAHRAGARRFADQELREAEIKLAALEQTWPSRRKDEDKFSGLAHDVMRLGERAREVAVERMIQATLEEERRA